MKKILLLNYEYPPLGGGASPISYEIAEKISEIGLYSIDVVTMGYKNIQSFEKINDNFRIHRVKCFRRKKEICYPLEQFTYIISAYYKCKKLIKKDKYDLCHVHFLVPTGILALTLKKKFNLNYIITSHGSDVPGHNKKRFKLLHKFTKYPIKYIIKNSKKIITPSNYLKKQILKSISDDLDKKINIIPNGININKYNPGEKSNYILTTGRLLKHKGFQYLIKAVSEKDIGYPVHICGNGPMMAKLKKMASNSETKIIFHGWINNKSKKYKDLLEKAAIFCLPSLQENASISLLEAMSAGCAVIASNVPGCIETVGKAGLFFKTRNYNNLNEKVNILINNKEKLKKYQLKSRERIVKNFNINKIVKEYIGLYEKSI